MALSKLFIRVNIIGFATRQVIASLLEIQQIFIASSSARCFIHKSLCNTIHPQPAILPRITALKFGGPEVKSRHFCVSMEALAETVSSNANDEHKTDEKYRQNQRDINHGVCAA